MGILVSPFRFLNVIFLLLGSFSATHMSSLLHDATTEMYLEEVTFKFNDRTTEPVTLGEIDWFIPQLEGECAMVTELEIKYRINLPEDSTGCHMDMIIWYEDIFINVTDDCHQCRCDDICPYYSEEENEKRFDEWAARIIAKGIRWNPLAITSCVTYAVTLLFGLTGNVLVIVTVARVFRPVNATNMFIASLATADLLVNLCVIPFRLYLIRTLSIWHLSAWLCKLSYYLNFAFFMASVFSLTAMSLERFFVICYPMKAQSMSTILRARLIIAIVWPLSFVLSLPVAFQTDKAKAECDIIRDFSDDDWSAELFFYIYLVVFIIPSVVIGYCYIRTACALWKSIKTARGMKSEKAQDAKHDTKDIKSRISVIKMLIVIWIIFILCWFPYLTLSLIYGYFGGAWIVRNFMNPETWNYVYSFSLLLSFANAAMNPILYAFMSRQFRVGFVKCFLSACKPLREKVPSEATSGFSRTRFTTAGALNTNMVSNGKDGGVVIKGKDAEVKESVQNGRDEEVVTNNGEQTENGLSTVSGTVKT